MSAAGAERRETATCTTKIRSACFATFVAVAFSHAALAMDPASVPTGKRTSQGLYLTAAEAHAHMTGSGARTLFVDVRSRAEAQFVGVPSSVDAIVPLKEFSEFGEFDEASGAYRLVENAAFVEEVTKRLAAKRLTKADAVIVICRSGSRSARAVDLLAKAGYARVYSVVDGFEGDKAKAGPHKGHRMVNGWKNQNLPWGYRLEKAKLAQVSW